MKIAVNGGHTPTSPGAGMYLDEVACDRAIKDALVAELRARPRGGRLHGRRLDGLPA